MLAGYGLIKRVPMGPYSKSGPGKWPRVVLLATMLIKSNLTLNF